MRLKQGFKKRRQEVTPYGVTLNSVIPDRAVLNRDIINRFILNRFWTALSWTLWRRWIRVMWLCGCCNSSMWSESINYTLQLIVCSEKLGGRIFHNLIKEHSKHVLMYHNRTIEQNLLFSFRVCHRSKNIRLYFYLFIFSKRSTYLDLKISSIYSQTALIFSMFQWIQWIH